MKHHPGVTVARYISRAPYGARGLKHGLGLEQKSLVSRAPYGARGLKQEYIYIIYIGRSAAPRTGRVG